MAWVRMDTRALTPFQYFQPKTIKEATSLLAKYGKEAKILAGGTDLLVHLKLRVIRPTYIIDISRIPRLSYIRYDKQGLNIGALTIIEDIVRSNLIQEKFTCLYESAQNLGSWQVRNMATIGGNVCRASPASDISPSLFALNSKAKINGLEGVREVSLEEFFTGPGQTVLKHDEILTEIWIPPLPANTGTAFMKISRTSNDLAKVNAAVALTIENGVCKDARIVLDAVGPTPIRARRTEKILEGRKLNEDVIWEASEVVKDEISPITDVRSTAEYRRDVSGVLVRRALRKAIERVK